MKYSITVIILSVFLCACGSDSSEKEDTTGLNGKWVSNCFEADSNIYHIKAYTFSGDSWSGVLDTYSDLSCTNPITPTSSAGGKFNLGNSVITETGVTAKELNFTIQIIDGIDYGPEGAVEGLDLIKIETNNLYFGDSLSTVQRTTKLNFDAVYYKL